jgi:hypothetical protein
MVTYTTGVGVQHHAPAALPPEIKLVIPCTGSCVGHRTGLDGA